MKLYVTDGGFQCNQNLLRQLMTPASVCDLSSHEVFRGVSHANTTYLLVLECELNNYLPNAYLSALKAEQHCSESHPAMKSPIACILVIFIGYATEYVHGCDTHIHQKYDQGQRQEAAGHHGEGEQQGYLRRLDIFDNIPETEIISSSNHPCKVGEANFTVGNVTYACRSDFQRRGGVCATAAMSPEVRVKADEHFIEWKNVKDKIGSYDIQQGDSRRLGGCIGCVNWATTTITIPTYIHVIHSGNTGKKYTYASNPAYIQNQIKVLNIGFRGEESKAFAPFPSRSYDRYQVADTTANIQFCLAGTTATNNQLWYLDKNEIAMKKALKQGGPESLNVYVNTASGYLGYAYYPESQDFVEDGVVILNDSMPNGDIVGYNEGDTLTHEVGHYLGLDHTFGGGCDGPGDYMDFAPQSANYVNAKSNEVDMTFGCPVDVDTCEADAGKNPIHSFMSYGDVSLRFNLICDFVAFDAHAQQLLLPYASPTHQDNCVDQFTPGMRVEFHHV